MLGETRPPNIVTRVPGWIIWMSWPNDFWFRVNCRELVTTSRAWIRLCKFDSIKPSSSSPRFLGSIELAAQAGRESLEESWEKYYFARQHQGAGGLVWDGHGKEQEEEKFKDLFSKNDKLPNTIQTDKGTEFLFKDTISLIQIEKQPLLNVSLGVF